MSKDQLKEKLQSELEQLEKELESIGRRNPENPNDWQALPSKMDALPADENEVADTIEEFEGNTAILKQLEIRYNEVRQALARLESNTYGTCEVCGKAIEEDRLSANPAATTCKEHMA
jgi:RNA polymerase-binding transcription factor DksA